MVPIVAIRDQGLSVVHGQETVPGAIVPAAWTLQQVATYRTHSAKLLAPYAVRRGDQGGIIALHFRVIHQLLHRRHGTDAQSFARVELDALKFPDLFQAYKAGRSGGPSGEVLHQADQVRAARHNCSSTPFSIQELHGCRDRLGARVFKGLH